MADVVLTLILQIHPTLSNGIPSKLHGVPVEAPALRSASLLLAAQELALLLRFSVPREIKPPTAFIQQIPAEFQTFTKGIPDGIALGALLLYIRRHIV